MPEGPELFLSSRFINKVCRGRIFGKIHRSEVSKSPVVQPPAECYTITSSTRGKELKVTLTENAGTITPRDSKEVKPKFLDILFTFGMSGKFDFYEATELQKHAHLNFYTRDSGPEMVLSFIDYRRFGKWLPGADFSIKDRGPCVLQDYTNFRDNVLQQLGKTVFNKPICEVLLDQKYFNGIGNYLRAEILHRAKIPPFVSARSVLESLSDDGEIKVKSETPDILQLCHLLPQEVVNLENSWYDGKDKSDNSNSFNSWLQCYYQDGMKNIADHNKRTIWYSGPLGPLAPKELQVRGKKKSKSRVKSEEKEKENGQETASKRRQKVKKEAPEEDSATEVKRTKLSKSAKAKRQKESNKEAEEKGTITCMKAEKRRQNKKKLLKENGDVSTDMNLSEELKVRLKTGRLTRGKIRQIVDAIDSMTEKTTNGRKKKEKVNNKKNAEKSADKLTAVTTENEEETLISGELKMSAGTKVKARPRKSSNGSIDLHLKGTQKQKLKTTQKRSIKRLSSS